MNGVDPAGDALWTRSNGRMTGQLFTRRANILVIAYRLVEWASSCGGDWLADAAERESSSAAAAAAWRGLLVSLSNVGHLPRRLAQQLVIHNFIRPGLPCPRTTRPQNQRRRARTSQTKTLTEILLGLS